MRLETKHTLICYDIIDHSGPNLFSYLFVRLFVRINRLVYV